MSKKSKTLLWVLGWLLIFPLPLTILIIRSQRLNKLIKIGVIAVVWGLYAIVGLWYNSSQKTENTKKITTEEQSIGVSSNIKSISFSQDDDITLKVGQKSSSSYAKVEIEDIYSFSPDDVEFVSENLEVAKIEFSHDALTTCLYYEITGIGPGETIVYACSKDKSVKSQEIKVTVQKPVEVDNITLEDEVSVLALGESRELTLCVSPDNAEDKSIIWESSDDSVLTVDDNGKITAVGNGTAVITAKAASGVMASQEWTVDASKRSMSLTVLHIRQDNNNIGDEWFFDDEINGEHVGQVSNISIGDSLNFRTTITESDDIPDVGEASKTHIVSEHDFENGFAVEMDVYVTENAGRNSGLSAHFIVTYKFSVEE